MKKNKTRHKSKSLTQTVFHLSPTELRRLPSEALLDLRSVEDSAFLHPAGRVGEAPAAPF